MRSNIVSIASVALIALTAATSTAQWAPEPETGFVFSTNSGNGSVLRLSWGDGLMAEEVLPPGNVVFEDLVVGPDLLLYVTGYYCQEAEGANLKGGNGGSGFFDQYGLAPCSGDGLADRIGLVIRMDPGAAAPADTIEVVHDGGLAAPLLPRGPWFDHRQNLLVSGGALDGGFFEFPGVAAMVPPLGAPVPAVRLLDTNDLGSAFDGQGTTQTANATALIADSGQGKIWSLDYDELAGGFDLTGGLTALSLSPPVASPLGIARLSSGELYVTDGEYLVSYTKQGFADCAPIVFDHPDPSCTSTPKFLEADADDWLLVASADDCRRCYQDCDHECLTGCGFDNPYPECCAPCDEQSEHCEACVDLVGGSLWAVAPQNNPDFTGNLCTATYLGSLPHGESELGAGGLLGLAVPPGGTPRATEAARDPYFYNFADHIYELGADTCSNVTDMNAQETPRSCLEAIIDSSVYGEFDEDGVPVGSPLELNASLVAFLGDKSFGQVYSVNGDDCGVGAEIFHAISAYTDPLRNPRLVKCSTYDVAGEGLKELAPDVVNLCDPPADYACELLPLASFFPGEGQLPEDARIGGLKSSTTSDFSQFFWVDAGEGGYDPNNPADPAEFCGFLPPVSWAPQPGPGMSVFREGRTVPLKFKVVAEGGTCKKGPFVAPEGILLSIARVEPGFEEKAIVCVGGGCSMVPYFDPPNNPRSGFHMNVRTDGFEPGIYIATLVATGGELPGPVSTYFEIVP